MKEFIITSIKDVQDFFEYLYNDLDLSFHPDSNFQDYVYNNSAMVRFFTDAEADYYNSVMDACFQVCEKEGADIYEIGMLVLG